ncbi:MAG: serine/threonine protein kinase [Planctomycetales bacterium]|nr:serine/threonine protein kinase [Planctomycetales bacterium]
MDTERVSPTPHSILEQAALASGLLTQEQIDRAWDALVAGSAAGDRCLNDVTDRLLADHLVELEYLNRWQAEQLVQGRTKFTLGPYRILDAIGRGGMGYVFKGEHQLLGRVEAIKVLPRTQMTSASIESFRSEIRAQAQLDHPNLIRLSFADRDGETYYLVTEFVPGCDLRRLVRRHGPLSDAEAAWVVSQAAEALAYVHERGLVHRDVKPGNLMITTEGQTKLADLGLAAFADDTLRSAGDGKRKSIVGTPDFLAPETIISPGAVRPVSDIYSLGYTLYYALTGKVPFPGGRTSDKIRRHVQQQPLSARQLNPTIDPRLLELTAAMTHKQPEERLNHAAAVVERLRPWTRQFGEAGRLALGARAEEAASAVSVGHGFADTLPAEGSELDTAKDSRGQAAANPASEPESPPAQPVEESAAPWPQKIAMAVVMALAAAAGAAAMAVWGR